MSLLRGVTVLLALSPSWCAAKPNLILFMADDFGYECVTANGGKWYRTPNLDRLAAGGVRFEQCHVQPLCTPTRVQLMTGRYNVLTAFMDKMIGRVDAKLAEPGIRDNTLLMFIGDNGTHGSVTSRFQGAADPDEAMPLGAAPLEGDAAPAAKKLQSVLDQFRDARPAELDRQFEQTMKGLPPAKPKKKRR